MNATTLKQAESDLQGLITQVVSDMEPTIIVTETGERVVLLPLDEYNAWQDTQYLLSNPVNAAHLRASIAQAENEVREGGEENIDVARESLYAALLASGLVRSIRRPRPQMGERRLIHVSGPPVSQTIIEDRR